MSAAIPALSILTFWVSLLLSSVGSVSINDIAGLEYYGTYNKTIGSDNFDYLSHASGDIVVIFFGIPLYQTVNSVDVYLLDPKYYDQKIKIVDLDNVSSSWSDSSHQIYYTTYWRERATDEYIQLSVNTNITFSHMDSDDQTDITIRIQMLGDNFGFEANLAYNNDPFQNLMYNLYISSIVALQLLCGTILFKRIGENQAKLNKISLLAVGYCSVQDFASALSFLQLIITSTNDYYFFVIPSAMYLVLFVLFDMKMLFLVWRSHNSRFLQNPEGLRKKLTTFYITFYLGLFIYLTLSYFFQNDGWFIIFSHLLLWPQIVHNVRTGVRPSFQIPYIFGYVFSRVLVPAYERGCPENFFKKRQDLAVVSIILTIYLSSIIFLLMQYRLGSRFFFPKRFQPQIFTYRRKVKLGEENKEDECSICLQNIFAKMDHQNILIQEQLLPEASIMVTPCNHQFHCECLLEWMEVKLECPTCRSPLPEQ